MKRTTAGRRWAGVTAGLSACLALAVLLTAPPAVFAKASKGKGHQSARVTSSTTRVTHTRASSQRRVARSFSKPRSHSEPRGVFRADRRLSAHAGREVPQHHSRRQRGDIRRGLVPRNDTRSFSVWTDARSDTRRPPNTGRTQGHAERGVVDRHQSRSQFIWTPPRSAPRGKNSGGQASRPDLGRPGSGTRSGGRFYIIRGKPAARGGGDDRARRSPPESKPRLGLPGLDGRVQPPHVRRQTRPQAHLKTPATQHATHGWPFGRPRHHQAVIFTHIPRYYLPPNYCLFPYHPSVIPWYRLHYWYNWWWVGDGFGVVHPFFGYDPWVYWGALPYYCAPWGYTYGALLVFRPLMVSYHATSTSGAGDYAYADRAPVSADAVLDDIRTAWLERDASFLAPHLHPRQGVVIADADGREEQLSAIEFLRLTEDGLAWMTTEYFEFVEVNRDAQRGQVTADALHVFLEDEGARQVVRVTYVLGRYNIGGAARWVIERVIQHPNERRASYAGDAGY